MYRFHIESILPTFLTRSHLLILGLVVANLFFTVIANSSFKLSAQSATLSRFVFWQVIGNLAGFATVIILTLLLRHLPLSIAFPLTTGLGVIGVQVFASRMFFNEPISPAHWMGTLLIFLGIVLLGR